MEYYWELKYGDYKELKSAMIPPASVQVVQRRWGNGDPIHLRTVSIPANQIRSFEITDKVWNEQPLLEAAAQAFNEPVYVDIKTDKGNVEQAIQSRWVKKNVTSDKWGRYYSVSPGYKYLGEDNGMVTMAFVLPVHLIKTELTPYCSDDEVRQLTRA